MASSTLTFPPIEEASDFLSTHSSETSWPFPLNRIPAKRVASPPPPEKLLNLFVQALFSAPEIDTPAEPFPFVPLNDSFPMTAPQLKALVVSSNENDLNAVCTYLRSFSFDTIAASNGDQALQVLGTQAISVLVLDWELSDAHGIVLAHAVRTMKIKQPVIIGMVNQLCAEIKELALSTGIDYFLDQPVTADALTSCLAASGFSLQEPEFTATGSAHQFPQVRQLATGRAPGSSREVYQTFIDELVDEGQALIASAQREQREATSAFAERLLTRARLIGEPQFTGLVRALHRSASLAEWETVRDLTRGFEVELRSLAAGMQRALCSEQISA